MSGELLPILIAELADDAGREFVAELGRRAASAWIPLTVAPVGLTRHVLEVYAGSGVEPLRVFAEPLGPPTEHGFPLRLVSIEEGSPTPATAEISPARLVGSPTARTLNLSGPHEAELGGAPGRSDLRALTGRAIQRSRVRVGPLVEERRTAVVYDGALEGGEPVGVIVAKEAFQDDVELARCFYIDALAISRLRHPNVLRVLDVGQESDGLLYVVHEHAARSLADVLRGGPLAGARLARVMMQVCDALAHAHARGVVHGALAPDSVFLLESATPDDDIVKLRFEPGRRVFERGPRDDVEPSVGPEHMSPEQCRGAVLDRRSDVYACGILLYELATGDVPFRADKPIVVVNRQLSMPPPPLSSRVAVVDPRLEVVVQRALRKSRAERYQDVDALRRDLAKLLRPATHEELAALASVASSRPPQSSRPVLAHPSTVPPPTLPPVALADEAEGATDEASAPLGEAGAPAEQAPGAASLPTWLEDKNEQFAQFFDGLASGASRATIAAQALEQDPASWLTKLMNERDDLLFEQMLADLDRAIRVLARRGDARALWAVQSALHGMATEPAKGPERGPSGGSRDAAKKEKARTRLSWFSDPALLGPTCERLLLMGDKPSVPPGEGRRIGAREAARTLVVSSGAPGAYALYGARVKLAGRPGIRAPFVATLRELGGVAWPVVRAAIERVPDGASSGKHVLGAELLEDLLLAAASVRDEAAGHVVRRYLAAPALPVARAAALALARIWGARSTPLLFALLEQPSDASKNAGIAGLVALGALEEHVVRKIAPLASRGAAPGELARLAAIQALASVGLDARPLAISVLRDVAAYASGDDPALFLLGRALLALGGESERALVSELHERASGEVRVRLSALLEG